MDTTLHLPSGHKRRTATQRRFVVVSERVETGTNVVLGSAIVYRSSDLMKIRDRTAREIRNYTRGPGWYMRFTAMDTTTGRPV